MSVLLFVLAIAQTSAAPRFDPADASAFARRASAANDGSSIERLRIALIVNPTAAAASLSPDERYILERAVGRIDATSANGLSWFFRTAVLAAPPPRAGVREVGYYNPIIDAAVATQWQLVDGRWRLTAARLADGAAQRGPALADAWNAASGESAQAAFAERAQATATLRPVAPMPLASFAQRIVAVERGLAALRQDHAAAPGAQQIVASLARAQLRNADFASGAPSSTMVAALPERVRRSLTIVAAYRHADAWLILLSSPLEPALVLFADLDAAGRPLRLSPVNLANRITSEVRP